MKINENDLLPNSEVFVLENGEPTKKKIEDFFKNKKVVLFGLPGAYTSVCSAKHLPGYVKLHDKYKEKGVDHIICISVNDPFVMNAWLEQQEIKQVKSLPDGNGDLAAQLGTLCQKTNLNFGNRSWRYALVLDGDTNTVLEMLPEAGFTDNAQSDPYDASTPKAVFKWVQENL